MQINTIPQGITELQSDALWGLIERTERQLATYRGSLRMAVIEELELALREAERRLMRGGRKGRTNQ